MIAFDNASKYSELHQNDQFYIWLKRQIIN